MIVAVGGELLWVSGGIAGDNIFSVQGISIGEYLILLINSYLSVGVLYLNIGANLP